MSRPPPAQPHRRGFPRIVAHSPERRAWAAGLVNLAAMGVEIAGGHLLNSAALLAEGYHMGAHVTAMLVAGVGYRLAEAVRLQRGQEAAKRVVDLAAVINVLILFAIAALLAVESLHDLRQPEPIPFASALALALFGLLVNGVSLALLHRPHAHEHGLHRDLSLYAIYLHMIGDAGVGVLSIGGLCLVAGLHWRWADGTAGLCGAVLIIALAVQIVAALYGVRRAAPSLGLQELGSS